MLRAGFGSLVALYALLLAFAAAAPPEPALVQAPLAAQQQAAARLRRRALGAAAVDAAGSTAPTGTFSSMPTSMCPPPPQGAGIAVGGSPPPPSRPSRQQPLTKPLVNDGRLVDGSQPTVLKLLGPARSSYHYYHPEYRVSTLYCADRFAGKPNEWLFAYPWIAYCVPYLGGMSQGLCGQCLRMTNNRTGKRIIVRIVDMCGHSAIDSDQQSAFIPLDSDGQGYLDGWLSVTLELVVC